MFEAFDQLMINQFSNISGCHGCTFDQCIQCEDVKADILSVLCCDVEDGQESQEIKNNSTVIAYTRQQVQVCLEMFPHVCIYNLVLFSFLCAVQWCERVFSFSFLYCNEMVCQQIIVQKCKSAALCIFYNQKRKKKKRKVT